MKHAIIALVFLFVFIVSSHAKPRNAKEGETQFLENADRYIREGPIAVKPDANPIPIAKETPLGQHRGLLPQHRMRMKRKAEKKPFWATRKRFARRHRRLFTIPRFSSARKFLIPLITPLLSSATTPMAFLSSLPPNRDPLNHDPWAFPCKIPIPDNPFELPNSKGS